MWNFWCLKMRFFSKRNNNKDPEGFSLPEVVVALVIVGLISSTILVAVNRYSELAINRQLRIEAFLLARENMEKLLASDTVEETLDYSSSDQNPDIYAKSVIETFYEIQTDRMWIRAVCSASYIDTQDQEQTIEFTHWVTDLSEEQMLKVLEAREWQKQELEEQQADGSDETRPDSDETPPDSDGTRPDSDETPPDSDETSQHEDKPRDWLPDGWNSMTRQEKLNWLLQSLMSSRR